MDNIGLLLISNDYVTINGHVMTRFDAKRKYPKEYNELVRKHNRSLKKKSQIKLFERESTLKDLDIKFTCIRKNLYFAELEGIKINLLYTNNRIEEKWLVSIDSIKQPIESDFLEGLFDPTKDYSNVIFDCNSSYQKNKTKFTIGFENDYKLFAFFHILYKICSK